MAGPSISVSTQEKILRSRRASAKVALLSTDDKNSFLLAIADSLEASQKAILDANAADVENSGMQGAKRDRLLLTSSRIKEMAAGVRDVAALPDRWPMWGIVIVWACPIPSARFLQNGPSPMGCISARSVCRWE